ncbi:MAG: hypothetical protein LBT46_00555 [Planctomycetaceae bacterium]|jgi:hypothetical protein|nr:hypothetical protein [Planctomycetaceae bacterium]
MNTVTIPDVAPFKTEVVDKRNGHVYLRLHYCVSENHPLAKEHEQVIKEAEAEKEDVRQNTGCLSRRRAFCMLQNNGEYKTAEDAPLAISLYGYSGTHNAPQQNERSIANSNHLTYIQQVRRDRLAVCKLLKRILGSDNPPAVLDDIIADLQFPAPGELFAAPAGTADTDWSQVSSPFDLDSESGRWLFEEARKWT